MNLPDDNAPRQCGRRQQGRRCCSVMGTEGRAGQNQSGVMNRREKKWTWIGGGAAGSKLQTCCLGASLFTEAAKCRLSGEWLFYIRWVLVHADHICASRGSIISGWRQTGSHEPLPPSVSHLPLFLLFTFPPLIFLISS